MPPIPEGADEHTATMLGLSHEGAVAHREGKVLAEVLPRAMDEAHNAALASSKGSIGPCEGVEVPPLQIAVALKATDLVPQDEGHADDAGSIALLPGGVDTLKATVLPSDAPLGELSLTLLGDRFKLNEVQLRDGAIFHAGLCAWKSHAAHGNHFHCHRCVSCFCAGLCARDLQ